MKEVYQVYDLVLTVEGPVFIGNGKEIGKKEYAFFPQDQRVAVMDPVKLSWLLAKEGLMEAYEAFLFGKGREDVGRWLEEHGILRGQYLPCARYEIDGADAVLEPWGKLPILEFNKDPYGNPYVPGSSIKGMLRTILLANDMMERPGKYQDVKKGVSDALMQNKKTGRPFRGICKRESAQMEQAAYRTLGRNFRRPDSPANDKLAGLLVGDSKPLSCEDLVLCQRVELHTDGTEKRLNMLREALRPGTVIQCQVTVDTTICDITKDSLVQAVARFGQMYHACFLKNYPGLGLPEGQDVWLGGGVGFATKTGVYPLFGEKEGVQAAMDIFQATGVPRSHKHEEDQALGVSPHVCKVAYYKGERRQMGHCRMRLMEQGGEGAGRTASQGASPCPRKQGKAAAN
ncbi:type III-A CRISPR-associated RAMP protein Csm5 [Lachnospiraceae bacterium 29-84]